MGEIAEAMLDGTLCEACGVYIEGESPNHPRYCSPQCAEDRGADWWLAMNAPSHKGRRPKTHHCPQCGKGFRSDYSLKQHCKDTGHALEAQEEL